MSPPRTRRAAALVAATALVALAVQYALLLANAAPALAPGMATLRFFSYFTVLSNCVVAVVCGAVASGRVAWPANARMQGAAALAIGMTGAVHALLLAPLLQLQGAPWWVDKALHVLVPLLYLGWWLALAPHGRLRAADLGAWLLFPLGYLAWIAVRATWIERWFPYPFLDVDTLGLPGVAANAALVALAFVLAGALLLMLDRWLGRRPR